jgi:hypothetical protein
VKARRISAYYAALALLDGFEAHMLAGPERRVLKDAAEAALLNERPDSDDLSAAAESAHWALDYLVRDSLFEEADAHRFWALLCECAPHGEEAEDSMLAGSYEPSRGPLAMPMEDAPPPEEDFGLVG